MTYFFSISGLVLRCELPFELKITRESQPFLLRQCHCLPDILVRFDPVSDVIPVPSEAIDNHGLWSRADSRSWDVYHKDPSGTCAYAHVCWTSDAPGTIRCKFAESFQNCISTSQNLLNLLGLEAVLLNADTLLLHSSLIRINGGAILFSAPSGTGKSTQAELWKRHRAADILNGDRAAIRFSEGTWSAWGLPYAGTSGIYRNESAPICGIAVLRQASSNMIRRLSPAEAMRFLYPELTLHRWEAWSVEKAVNLLSALVSAVPVFLLECRADEGAVEVLEQALEETKL